MAVTLELLAFKNRRPLVVYEHDTELAIKSIIARHCRCSKEDFTLAFDRPFDTNLGVFGFTDGDQAYVTFVYKTGTAGYQRCQRTILKGFAAANAKNATFSKCGRDQEACDRCRQRNQGRREGCRVRGD